MPAAKIVASTQHKNTKRVMQRIILSHYDVSSTILLDPNKHTQKVLYMGLLIQVRVMTLLSPTTAELLLLGDVVYNASGQ